MTPKEYLDRYTRLSFVDPVWGFPVEVSVTGYGSGWGKIIENGKVVRVDGNRIDTGQSCQAEFVSYYKPALRYAHHNNKWTPTGEKFYFNDKDKQIDIFYDTEDFYVSSLVNAFNGKGSPDEITDALRIALAIGRIGTDRDLIDQHCARARLQDYVDAFITLDCNGLVGNYYGINPNTSVGSYANPARCRKRQTDVQVGDSVVTVTNGSSFEHVALIADWTNVSAGYADVKLVEWGGAGGEDNHYTGDTATRRQILQGANAKFGIGFQPAERNKFRYIFAPPQSPVHRGW